MVSSRQEISPREVRMMAREGKWTNITSGVANGYVQANLVVLPGEYAYDFLLFCLRNPKPCPLLDVTDRGVPRTRLAPDADLRTDLPKYRIYENGKLAAEVTDISPYWTDSLVAFLIGCSHTFEAALQAAGIPLRHIQEGTVVPMYTTNIECVPAGPFRGPMVVSMRPIPWHMVSRAVQITSRYPSVHGAPVHIGDPSLIGVRLEHAEFGSRLVQVRPDEVPVFWACGVTPQAVAMAARVPFMITHAPGHMFVSDVPNEALAVL